MRVKNYTSGVPVDRTISRIEVALAAAGASGIMKDYSDGKLASLTFKIELPDTREIAIRLPANHEAVYNALRSEISRPRPGTLEKLHEQALRTSWKLMQDWIEVQLSLIKMQQVDVLQVFLPYVWDGKRTYYMALKDSKYKALLPAPPEPTE